ncbi:MAG: hypothetical protein ACPL7O_04840, partial [Armatimonadota bacterium]
TLGFQWEWIPLNAFHQYFDTWDRLYGLSTHAHAHGMHYIEFTHKIRQRIKEAGLFLTGVFGDCWAGRIQFPPIEGTGKITLLGYTHGMNADSRQSLFATDYPLRKGYWEENSDLLADDRFRAIEVARTRAMLLSYFNRVPRYYGFEPYSPFVDLELAMKMITLPPERRQKRTWQREFFEKNGLDLENMGLVTDTRFSLDMQAIRSRPIRPLDRGLLREVVRGEYVDWINQNLADISARTAVSDKTLAAYYAYLVLLPVENLIRKRDAHYYGQQQDNDQEALLRANQKRVFPKAHLLDESTVQPIETFRQGVESYASYLKPTGQLYDPVFGEPTQYGTAYYALCNAILATNTEGNERRKYLIRAENGLEAALEHVSDLSQPPTASGFKRDTGEVYRANHRDFFWPAILKTFRLLTRLQAPGTIRFARQIADVEIKRAFSDRPPSNVAAVWLAGEWLRFCEGLSPYTIDQIDEWISSFFAERIVIDKGLYLEPGYPNSYDLFTRYHLAELLLEGYHSIWENALEQLFVNGARRSLAFQLSDGSLASAHRSTGQTWTLGIQCAFFTHVANYFQERDADLASRAMQAAQRAYQAMRRWQRRDEPYSPVENCLPPGYRIGYEFYTADGHYGPLALSFLGIAIHNGFRLTQSDTLDRAPSVYIEYDPTYRAIVHSGRYSVHVNANPTPEYDGLGIVDLTFGSGRYFHFVSSAKHIETGRIFNLGMACRNNPIERAELIVMAQQPSTLIGSIEKGELPASLRMVTRLRSRPYAYMMAVTIDDQDGVHITESTPGIRNYKTLLIPYVRDLGIGSTTEVQIKEQGVNLLLCQEEIAIILNQETDKIIHLPYGFENRRGLCGLVRVDFREPCEGISYWVKVIR